MIKLSDRFTRGVPDCLVVGTGRTTMVEFKITRGSDRTAKTAKNLGLTELQAHRLLEISRRNSFGGVVLTGNADGEDLKLWAPSGYDGVFILHCSDDEVLTWLTTR